MVLLTSDRTMERISSFATSDSQFNQGEQLKIFQDTTKLIFDAPLSGFGLGSSSTVFPQYREASKSYLPILHPQSDLLWLASEGGLLAIGFLSLFLIGFALRYRGMMEGGGATFRLLALVAVIIFYSMDWSMYLGIIRERFTLPSFSQP